MSSLPYPPMDEDQQLRLDEERAAYAREHLDPSEVLSEVQSLMLGIADDTQNPLWRLIEVCTRIGTTQETGQRPRVAEGVGAAFLPLINRAITRLVTERLSAWED